MAADVSNPNTLERELRALEAASLTHRRTPRRLLVLDRDTMSGVRAKGIEVRPAYEWLLDPVLKGKA